ncbi:MAG: hypothetical protein HYU64_11880, partial [Armatimonadetes bacterium]|nr:hypothetical protein [Armatimonadota bacterium]
MANRSQKVETALRRSKIYRLLSVGFSCPSPGGASEILDSLRELSDLTSQESHVGPVPPVTQDLICSHDRL